MNAAGLLPPAGDLQIWKRPRRGPGLRWKLANYLRLKFILSWLGVYVLNPVASFFGLMTGYGRLEVVHFRFTDERDRRAWQELRSDLSEAISLGNLALQAAIQKDISALESRRERVDYGLVGLRVVTTAFVTFVTDQLQTESSLFGDFKFHDSGVGTTAENIADTAIETTDAESRATGTQTESAANAYRSVGTISYTTTKAITEHGLFNDATTGTLMDRTVFAAVNVISGDSVQYTYTLTLAAGG